MTREPPYEDPDDDRYDALLAAMDSLTDRTEEEAAAARARFASKKDAWTAYGDELRASVAALSADLTGLKAGVPDLRPDGGADPGPDAGLDGELDEARRRREEGDRLRADAVDTARLPALLPRARPILRNAIVYGATMIVCVVVQFVLRGEMRAGRLPQDAWLWIGLLLPVMFLFVGYLVTGVTGRPRLPTLDDKGREVPFTVHRSPRLGVVMTVAAIAVFLLT